MEELLNPSVSNRPLIIPRYSYFTRKFSIKTRKSKSLCKFHNNPFTFSFSTTTNVRLSAHFGGPTNRRNSLRKKLIDDQQVRQNSPVSLNPSSDFQKLNLYTPENLDVNSLEESDSNYGLGAGKNLSWKRKSKKLGESVMSSKLERWVDEYNKDISYWGIGSSHIFTIFHDLEGNVKRVLVDENEILKRSQVGKLESGDVNEVNSKILYAKRLASEMERGGNVIPRNSSVAKFVVSSEDSGFVRTIRGVILQPQFIPVVLGFGKISFCSFFAIWALKKLFAFGNKDEQLTELEKEMMRRKIKARKEKDIPKNGEVEVVQETSELSMPPTEKPKMDKQELMRNILEAKAKKDKLLLVGSSGSQTTHSMDFNEKIQKIRAMAREAREIEFGEQPVVNNDREEKQPVNEELSSQMEMVEKHTGEVASFVSKSASGESGQNRDVNDTQGQISLDGIKGDNVGCLHEVSFDKGKVMQSSENSRLEVSKDMQTTASGEVKLFSDHPDCELHMPNDRSTTVRRRIIRSVKEAREFLAKKENKHSKEPGVDTTEKSTIELTLHSDKASGCKTSQRKKTDRQVIEPVALGRMSDPLPAADIRKDLIPISTIKDNSNNTEEGYETQDVQNSQTLFNGDTNSSRERRQSDETENWIEKNFHEVEPLIKKIGEGIRDNYKLAREKVNQDTLFGVANLDYNQDDSEFEWMKDDDLKEIVFQVRENELSGRDPFYLMDAEDKLKFFKGLEENVEKENEKLLKVHEYLHSNIENLDYGADGISLYDQPEKFIPRWKGPPLGENPEFLNNFQNQRTGIAGNADTSYLGKDEQIQKSIESTDEDAATSLSESVLEKNLHNKDAKHSKTIIEGSDGSIKAGKKSGKEFWQHTKKWSRGFLESCNAETDPEIKSIMKDMGKDLDRWITEEEIQEAADLMKKLPERSKEFMEKKMTKIKREMELFGPQAVVSKYREYAEEKEEDYLWWLDLPHILCIELYTTQNGEQKIGFYSLEMGADLELEPKPCHVIAFEDAGDCKNFCYIVQAHMDMLGNGHAFVVPRPPKDAFRDAKASGFGVTVIRKRELELNVDQTLEEVEEQIAEIGSKMYHDELMRERSIDISALMKGVFGFRSRPASRRKKSRRTLMEPGKK
ncbi:uncharacterized protein LOC8263519 [Ricinus communis]|uniref:uncharacterized protein LOC8263519 n=1 Tax=Ricinus communis TaxID=3988 RepID=UPI00201A94D0|nr:uncharacterized protein LOC8263519 [Ricinus communis]